MGEAAQRLGVSIDTIRRRLRRGELKGRHQLTPQGFIWLIEVPEPVGANTDAEHGAGKAPLHLASAPAGSSAVRANAPGNAAPAANDLQALRELVEVLRHKIEAKDRQLDSQNRQIEQLHVLLQQAQSSPLLPGQLSSWDPGITGLTAGQSVGK
jgi:hypothetical protein